MNVNRRETESIAAIPPYEYSGKTAALTPKQPLYNRRSCTDKLLRKGENTRSLEINRSIAYLYEQYLYESQTKC